jgi:hypothetical protein
VASDGLETFQLVHRFAVVGYVMGELLGAPDTAASERLWDVHKDTVVCLSDNPLPNGLVDELIPDPDDSIDTDEGAIEPFAWFVQSWIATRPGDTEEGV